MKHKRRQVLTTQLSFDQFEKQAYSAKLFGGTVFINLKAGRFAYRDDLSRQVAAHIVYDRARTVMNLKNELIAKRKTKDQPLRKVRYERQ